ncbi:hypothetical protein BH09PLA1_BH09PLA1_32670 [soil metagenome]
MSSQIRLIPLVIALSLQIATAAPSTAPALPPSQADFMRLIDAGTTGSRLETADVAYRNADGVTVHLVSAVHVGERSYFEGLNQNFKLRDAVLYEMVKPRGADMPAPGVKVETTSAVSQVQRMMKEILGLEFQLDVVDYSPLNFVHADLDAETFEKMQNERGESFTNMILQAFMKSLAQPPSGDEPLLDPARNIDSALEDLVKLFTRPDIERQMKLRLARQLADLENNPFGPDALSGSVLLTERNKAAIATLDRTIKEGKRDIAIFYGAAHMPEIARMLDERGFKPVATEWRMAWDLTIRADAPSGAEKFLMELLRGAMEPEPDDNGR